MNCPQRDLVLIFENALAFNQPGSAIHSYSKDIKDKVVRQLDKVKFLESEPVAHGSVKKSDRRHSVSGKDKKEGGKRSSGLFKVKVPLSKKFVPVAKIVGILEELRSSDSRQLFQKPLDKDSDLSHNELVKEPVDFSTIGERISEREYITFSDFLVWHENFVMASSDHVNPTCCFSLHFCSFSFQWCASCSWLYEFINHNRFFFFFLVVKHVLIRERLLSCTRMLCSCTKEETQMFSAM
jgi:hypothetical protein